MDPTAELSFDCIKCTFYIQEFWAICACPEKQRVPWIHCTEYVFLSFRIFEQLALALKNRVPLEFFTVLRILFTFRIFEQLALALKNKVALEFFTALNMYFLSFRMFEQLALAPKYFNTGEAAAPTDSYAYVYELWYGSRYVKVTSIRSFLLSAILLLNYRNRPWKRKSFLFYRWTCVKATMIRVQ